MIQRFTSLCALAFVALAPLGSFAAGPDTGVRLTTQDDKLVIEIEGKPFAEYHHRNVPRPFLYPLLGPMGEKYTRSWPMAEAPNEERDHPHHRSLWYAHGDVNGHDFWSEGPKAGRIVHQGFARVESGAKSGSFTARNQWVAKDGTVVCTDERTIRIHHRSPAERLLDFEITLQAPNGDVVLGDTKEGTMAVRLNEAMRLKGKVATGHIVNSEGVRDGETWGKRARWCDYYGTVDGRTIGLAIFDHPSNPKHPTWWHVRDYGLFAANPFGVHDFEKKPAGTGNLTIPKGQTLTFRYRFYLHAGDEKSGQVEQRYQEYSSENKK